MGLGLGFGLENKEDQSTLSTVNYMIAVCDFIHLIATRTVCEHGLSQQTSCVMLAGMRLLLDTRFTMIGSLIYLQIKMFSVYVHNKQQARDMQLWATNTYACTDYWEEFAVLLQATIICHIGEEFTTEQEVIMAWTGIPKNIAYTVQHYKIHHNNQQRLTLCRMIQWIQRGSVSSLWAAKV